MTELTSRLLLFTIGEERYALDLQDVAEVLGVPVTFPVPWAPACIKGAMNFHGRVVAVLDLAQFIGVGTMPPDGNVLVLNSGLGNVALGVDCIGNIIPADDVLEEDGSDLPMVQKLLILADGEVKKLSIESVLEKAGKAMQR